METAIIPTVSWVIAIPRIIAIIPTVLFIILLNPFTMLKHHQNPRRLERRSNLKNLKEIC